MQECELCISLGGHLLWRDDYCRVVLVGGKEGRAFPGYCRVVWHAHVREFTDLSEPEQARLMRVVAAVEAVLRARLSPDKINLASLGNLVPHLHWHVIPRWRDDSHFPAPIWGESQRRPPPSVTVDPTVLAGDLAARLAAPR